MSIGTDTEAGLRFCVDIKAKGQVVSREFLDDADKAMRRLVEIRKTNFGVEHGVGSSASLTDNTLKLCSSLVYEGHNTYMMKFRKEEGRAFYDATESKLLAEIQEGQGGDVVLKQALTPRQIEATMTPGCPKPGEVERLYAARDAFVSTLKEKGRVEPADLANLDRLGRFKVADECWGISSDGARKAMLDDPHHQVRSAAVISQQQMGKSAKERQDQASRHDDRESKADDVFEKYHFGQNEFDDANVTIVDHDSWNTDDINDHTKIVYPNCRKASAFRPGI